MMGDWADSRTATPIKDIQSIRQLSQRAAGNPPPQPDPSSLALLRYEAQQARRRPIDLFRERFGAEAMRWVEQSLPASDFD
jgi:hypothetical protein